MGVHIAGLGIYEGPKVREKQWIDSIDHLYGPVIHRVSKSPGIEWRQLHEPMDTMNIQDRNDKAKELSLKMSIDASLKAIEDAEVDPSRITHIIWVSSTSIGAPAMDLHICNALNLSPWVIRLPIMMAGCSGGGVGLHMAWSIVMADEKALCLLVATDVSSPWLKIKGYGDTNLAIANTIFSDGAGAMILGSKGKARLSRPISYLVPDTMDHMAIDVRSHGLYPCLSPTIHLETSKNVPLILDRLGFQDEEPNQYLVHPGGKSILTAIGHRDKVDASWYVLENYGNMSSSSIFYVISQVWKDSIGSYPIITFGQGLHIAAIRMDK